MEHRWPNVAGEDFDPAPGDFDPCAEAKYLRSQRPGSLATGCILHLSSCLAESLSLVAASPIAGCGCMRTSDRIKLRFYHALLRKNKEAEAEVGLK